MTLLNAFAEQWVKETAISGEKEVQTEKVETLETRLREFDKGELRKVDHSC